MQMDPGTGSIVYIQCTSAAHLVAVQLSTAADVSTIIVNAVVLVCMEHLSMSEL